MPGTPLDLDYPEAGDSTYEAINKLVDAIETIEADLEAKVTPAEINVTASLDMNGQNLVDVGEVRFQPVGEFSGVSNTIGFKGGELYAITADDEVQLTANGALNTTTSGAWGGDYGTGGASADFQTSSGNFRFFSANGDYGDLSAEGLKVQNGDTGSNYIRHKAASSVSGTDTYEWANNDLAATGLLQVTSAGVVTPATIISGNLTFSGTNTFNTFPKHGDRVRMFAPGPFVYNSGLTLTEGDGYIQEGTVSNLYCIMNLPGFHVGDRIKSFKVRAARGNAGTKTGTFTLQVRSNTVGGSQTITDVATDSYSVSNTTIEESDGTTLSATTLTTADTVTFRWSPLAAGSGLRLYGIEVTYDRP